MAGLSPSLALSDLWRKDLNCVLLEGLEGRGLRCTKTCPVYFRGRTKLRAFGGNTFTVDKDLNRELLEEILKQYREGSIQFIFEN